MNYNKEIYISINYSNKIDEKEEKKEEEKKKQQENGIVTLQAHQKCIKNLQKKRNQLNRQWIKTYENNLQKTNRNNKNKIKNI